MTPELAQHHFLWFQLGTPDVILPVLAAAVYLLQAKVSQQGIDSMNSSKRDGLAYLSFTANDGNILILDAGCDSAILDHWRSAYRHADVMGEAALSGSTYANDPIHNSCFKQTPNFNSLKLGVLVCLLVARHLNCNDRNLTLSVYMNARLKK